MQSKPVGARLGESRVRPGICARCESLGKHLARRECYGGGEFHNNCMWLRHGCLERAWSDLLPGGGPPVQRCVETGVKGRGKRDCAVRCRGVLFLFVLVNVVPERFCAESKPRGSKKMDTVGARRRDTETQRHREFIQEGN